MGHFGCNSNGQHEKCDGCPIAKGCSQYKQIYFRNKRMTNADRIRAMSDEELAEFLSEVKYDGIYYKEGQEYPMIPEIWEDWIQSEVEGQKNG